MNYDELLDVIFVLDEVNETIDQLDIRYARVIEDEFWELFD